MGSTRRRAAVLAGLTVVGMLTAAVAAAPAASAARKKAVVTDISYGYKKIQYIRVGRPAGSTSAKRPTVIFVHGGGWERGGISEWQKEAGYWLSKGWLTVNVSYRKGAPGANSHELGQQMLADMQAVVAKVRTFKDVDRKKIMMVGDSVGGHLASYAAGRNPSSVSAMMLWSPVASPAAAERTAAVPAADAECDGICEKQRDLARAADELFGYSARTTDPLTYLGPGKARPRTWIAASEDEWVPYSENGEKLCAATGCEATVIEGGAHGMAVLRENPDLVKAARRWAGRWAGIA